MVDNSSESAATGKVVAIHYTLTSSEGHVLDRSGDEPLSYLHGHENIVPGLERQIDGRSAGDKFRTTVPPEEGYGERAPGGPKALPKDAFPEDVEVEAGMHFAAQGPDGQVIPLWVVGVEDEQVYVDPNHPLAGETLTFDVEVVNVRDATSEEAEHGHVHGAGGAHE